MSIKRSPAYSTVTKARESVHNMEGRTRSSRQKLPTPTALPTKSAVGYATTTTTTAKPKAAAAAVVGVARPCFKTMSKRWRSGAVARPAGKAAAAAAVAAAVEEGGSSPGDPLYQSYLSKILFVWYSQASCASLRISNTFKCVFPFFSYSSSAKSLAVPSSSSATYSQL